jgi:hypothetical protein
MKVGTIKTDIRRSFMNLALGGERSSHRTPSKGDCTSPSEATGGFTGASARPNNQIMP